MHYIDRGIFMNAQEALRSLLEGRKVRQVSWNEGDYISHWKRMWSIDEQTGLPIHDPASGLEFFNAQTGESGPILEEDAAKAFEADSPWELVEEPADNIILGDD